MSGDVFFFYHCHVIRPTEKTPKVFGQCQSGVQQKNFSNMGHQVVKICPETNPTLNYRTSFVTKNVCLSYSN